MFEQADYLMGWGVYLAGVFTLLAVVWFWTSRWRVVDLRNVVRLLLAAILLTPIATAPGSSYLSPAIVVGLMEFLSEGNPARALAPVMVFAGVALAVSLLLSLLRR